MKIDDLESGNKKYKDLNRQLEFQVDEINEQLEKEKQQRKNIKNQLREASDKIIELEEELYQSKQTASELTEHLK